MTALNSRSTVTRILLAFTLLLSVALPQASASVTTGRAISLNAVKSALVSGSSANASRLCGITRMTGYIIDKKANDVILIGEVDPDLPALSLDDLVVAMRNVWLLYTHTEGRIRYYSAPGCSIDPNPKILRQLRQVHEKRVDMSDPRSVQDYLDDWQAVGSQPQKVRVMGVPYDTRFAKVMVDADYYMKRLVNGSVQLNIRGFDSLSDMTVNLAKQELAAHKPSSIPAQSLNRFWFSPGESTYSEEDDGVVLLRSCQVELLTEEEFLTQQGQVAGMGRPNPLAKRFAGSFSAKYGSIATARPIYAELEDLFRFVALAKLVKSSGSHSSALSYLLKTYRVKNTPVSRTLPGLTSARQFTGKEDDPDGYAGVYVLLPSCGGVSMDVRPKRIRPKASTNATVNASPNVPSSSTPTAPAHAAVGARTKRTSGNAPVATATSRSPRAGASSPRGKGLKRTVLGARKSTSSLSWDFPVGDTR